MRVYCYPADTTGCGFYRITAPARALQAEGYDVHIVLPDERTGGVGLRGMQDQHGNLVDVIVPADADVMVLQRITMDKLVQAIPLIRAKGIAVVVDMDDDLTTIDPRNIAWEAMHPKFGKAGHSWANATKACVAATMVTVSTPALLKVYAPHGRGAVVDNYVPASYLEVPHRDSGVIGWAGSVRSHPGDLPALGASLSRLERDGYPIAVVGDGVGVADALGLHREPAVSGLVPIEEWPNAVATLGVGVAPLADTRFNRSKSRLKPLEMSACGVPWVASPRVEYQKFHQLGCGLLADKPAHWYRQLRGLAESASRRQELSQAGREIAARLTIEGNAWRWWEVWASALRMQRVQAASALTRT